MLERLGNMGVKDVNRQTLRSAFRALGLAGAMLASQLAASQGPSALPGELLGSIQDYDAASGVIVIDGKSYTMSPLAEQVLSAAPVGATGYRGLSVEYSVTEMPDGTWVVDRFGIVQDH